MSFKIVIITAFLAIVQGSILQPASIVTPVATAIIDNEYDPNPQYSYGYDVQDSVTGDSKSQVESRNGDVVQGSYSLNDPDGTRRTVDYVADPINGFKAVVRKTPIGLNQAVLVANAVPGASVATRLADTAPISSLVHTSSSVVHSHVPVATHFVAPFAISAYSAPLISHLAYSTGSFAYGHPTFYSTFQHKTDRYS